MCFYYFRDALVKIGLGQYGWLREKLLSEVLILFPFLLCMSFGCIEIAVLQIPRKEIRPQKASSTAECSSSSHFCFFSESFSDTCER